ncbi:hybrid sensor histidine kinase/response regulator transcription factor [Seonamhaeicola marinus]|uniref:histidine kinase n=1 Tax=Seonamhaeicola marinus TaxID=1912246 RepID=A0A5D0ILH3_9FLAO|nr:hybrid sensor histidine kinase/response regulator transcription factor [Seonamhaeicola marinus]TYA84346.1 response regulator [Seonamhaeicola marinus]
MTLYSKIKIFLFLLLAGSTFIASSQSQPVFKKIDQSNNLSNGRVNAIVKESHGFVWIGTNNGLNRYDGNQIKVYNKQNSRINSNQISCLFIDHKSRLWVGTLGGGLCLYKAEEDTFITYRHNSNSPNSIASNEINTIFEDSKGQLWLGTKNGLSLFKESDNIFMSYGHKLNDYNSLSHNDVRSIYEDVKGNLWIGTYGGGLNKFIVEETRFIQATSTKSIASDFIHSMGGVDSKTLIIGTHGGGLLEFDLNTLEFSRSALSDGAPINIVRCIRKDRKGNFWIGTDGNGLFEVNYKNGETNIINSYSYDSLLESSISSNAIYSIFEDENFNVWIGTAWDGVNVLLQNRDFTLLQSTAKEETSVSVLSIYKDRNQSFLGLDGKGLTVLNTNNQFLKRYSKETSKSAGGDYIQFIKKGSNKTYWLGTFVNGLVNFNPETGVYSRFQYEINNNRSLSYDDVRYIVEDASNNLWVATWGGGLNYFDIKTKEFSHYRHVSQDSLSISSDNIISMQKEGNNLWLATFGGGVSLFNTKTKRSKHLKYSESNTNSISSDYLNCILKDSKGNLWIGTAGEGATLYNPKTNTFKRFSENEIINSQSIVSIIEDNTGVIWFSTKQGIFSYNYETNQFENFSSLAGEYHINASFKDDEGLLYFGSSTGLIMFNPASISSKNINPEVKFTGFKLFNEEVPIGETEILQKNIDFQKQVTLKHNLDVITFEFAAMEFPFSKNCEYAIKLDGFDKNWRNIGKERSATYTNLSPGDYELKVKSRGKGSNWGNKATTVKVKVLKPFWLEWWAFVVYGIFIVLAFYVFRKYVVAWEQMKSKLELERLTHEKDIEVYNLKQEFFTNISHEIRTPVTLILASINRIINTDANEGGFKLNAISTLKKNSSHLLNLVNELLDFRKLEQNEIKLKVSQENWVKFCEEIYLSFLETAKQKNISFSFETMSPNMMLWIDRAQMDKVMYNLLSNAFKFTPNNSSIKLALLETEENVTMVLEDTGVGISKKQLSKIFNRFHQSDAIGALQSKGFGLGLSITKEIVALHSGDIQVESKKGEGATFTVILKKGRAHFKEEHLIGKEMDAERIENYLIDTKAYVKKVPADINTHKDETLLIVEDNHDIRAYIADFLSNEFNIIEASDGVEGLEKARNVLPDLIISDVMMPNMNGIKFTQELKTDIITSHIPVILLTARASTMHQMEGFNIGADEYVTKPFNELLLRSRIKNLIRNRVLLHKRFKSEEIVPVSELAKNKADQDFLHRLGRLIESNIDSESLKANFVAKELGMSHSVIYKKLKVLTSMSLVEYVRDYKLKIAKRLLIEKGYTVAEVAYHVGYSDRKYFSKLFKQRFGKNPSSFLRK